MEHLKKLISYSKTNLVDGNREHLMDLIEEVHPFVFTSDPNEPKSREVATNEMELDLPFPVCSFEDINWRKVISTSTKNFREDVMVITEPTMIEGKVYNDIIPTYRVSCFLVHEVAPKEYEFFIYDSYDDFVAYIDSKHGVYKDVVALVKNQFINQLKSKKVEIGVEKVKERIKTGTKKQKRTHVIRKVVYVSTKQSYKEQISARSINWDYSHRWEVRGHWRRLPEPNKLGKNRDGEYCVRGFTWVREHEKGPEDAPLVKDKTRVVETN